MKLGNMFDSKMINVKLLFIISSLLILAMIQVNPAGAEMNVVNMTQSVSSGSVANNLYMSGTNIGSMFVVDTLKYEPYPVAPGTQFNLWIKVENIGQDDSPGTTFELVPQYPFTSTDQLARDYGTFPGTASAFNNMRAGEVKMQSNQAIILFRVKVDANAMEGTNTVNFMITNSKGINYTIALPIEIEKTGTDFDVVMQDSNAQGMSFAIANTGANTANAVLVTLENTPGYSVIGPSSTILGNLAAGDFTTFSFDLTAVQRNSTNATSARNFAGNAQYQTNGANANAGAGQQQNNLPNNPSQAAQFRGNFTRNSQQGVTMKIDYTDSSGVRDTVEKTVSLPSSLTARTGLTGAAAGGASSARRTATVPVWVYIIFGFFIGVIASVIYVKIKGRKHK